MANEIKSINGVPIAQIKAINGIPIANIKMFNGMILATTTTTTTTTTTAAPTTTTTTTTAAPITLGASYRGGIIFYIDGSGQHGLIAATSDQSTGIQWSNGAYLAVTTGFEMGYGNSNTNNIIAVQGAGSYAAQLCADLSLGGYSDWYLPSQVELRTLKSNMNLVGNFGNSMYWSSSQYQYNKAYAVEFDAQYENAYSTATLLKVRAIRTF